MTSGSQSEPDPLQGFSNTKFLPNAGYIQNSCAYQSVLENLTTFLAEKTYQSHCRIYFFIGSKWLLVLKFRIPSKWISQYFLFFSVFWQSAKWANTWHTNTHIKLNFLFLHYIEHSWLTLPHREVHVLKAKIINISTIFTYKYENFLVHVYLCIEYNGLTIINVTIQFIDR